MNLKSMKTPADLQLKGVTIQTETTDGNLSGITIIDTDGNCIVIRLSMYSLTILVPADDGPSQDAAPLGRDAG